jgi:hypothetical protein
MEQWPHICGALSGSNAISTSCGYSEFSACRNRHREMQQLPIGRSDPASKELYNGRVTARLGLSHARHCIRSCVSGKVHLMAWALSFLAWPLEFEAQTRKVLGWAPESGVQAFETSVQAPLRDSICRWQPFHVLGVTDAGSLMLYKSQMTGQTIVGLQYGCIV